MDELKDFMDIRIVTRCPMCGKRFKKLTIELNEHTPIWITAEGQCDCGPYINRSDKDIPGEPN